ncbi:MAG: hypothetical protein QOH23_719 [Gaiellaceae bacterium]|nr:hypothetical protein [Gaiellaceae bacterium]
MRRFATTFSALAALSLAWMTSSALAAPTASHITTPTGTAYLEMRSGLSEQATAVRGTTTGPGNVDLKCYYAAMTVTVKSNVAVTANRFDTSLTKGDLAAVLPDRPCVLRAVPTGDAGAHPPSATSDPFAGPTIAASDLNETLWSNGAAYEFDLYGIGGSGLFQIESADAGIRDSRLVEPSTLATTQTLFDIGSGFNGGDLVNIDGSDAFVVGSLVGQAGWQGISDLHMNVDPYTGAVTIHELEPVLSDDSGPAPTGVALERTWTIGQDGRVASVSDRWRSMDGQAHSLKVRYQNEIEGAGGGAAVDFPGSAGFRNTTDYSVGEQVTLPHGPATAYLKHDASTPDAGDGSSPNGGLTYSKTPDAPAKVVYQHTDSGTSFFGWDMPYDRTIPAGGDQTFRFSYSMGFSLSAVHALAADAENGTRPTLAITAPTDGSSSAVPTVTVTGTAGDTGGTPSLLVGGQATNVASDGTWSRQVTLSAGANTITAQATDADGNSTSRSVNVTYSPPAAGSAPVTDSQAPAIQPAQVSLVGGAHAMKGGVRFRIRCLNQACQGTTKLQSVEVLRTAGGVPTAVRSARASRKTVTVGSGTFALAAGSTETVTLKLNATGLKLLKRFKRLPAKLTVALKAAPPLVSSAVLTR